MAEEVTLPLTDEEAEAICASKDAATQILHFYNLMKQNEWPMASEDYLLDFMFQQTMYRIKDPRRSLEFYTKVLGMTLLVKKDFPAAKFSLYFMGYEPKEDVPKDPSERATWAMTRKATLELTHNWGTENDPEQSYNIGNKDGIGYGHIGILVPDVYEACKRFEENGVEFVKKPDDGRMKGLAFIKDPDGYWIEIFTTKCVK